MSDLRAWEVRSHIGEWVGAASQRLVSDRTSNDSGWVPRMTNRFGKSIVTPNRKADCGPPRCPELQGRLGAMRENGPEVASESLRLCLTAPVPMAARQGKARTYA